MMAGHQLAHPHRQRGGEEGHQEDRPVTAKQQAEGPAGEPHHGHHQPGMIVERHYGIEPLAHLARADQLFLRQNAEALDLAHHLHVDALIPHPAGSGDAMPLIEAGQHYGTGGERHLDALQPQCQPKPDRGLFYDACLGTILGQQLAHLDDDPGDLCLLLLRQHPSWCDTSHHSLES
ncbi:hypothetical protein D3C79_642610 [compost metagenome]